VSGSEWDATDALAPAVDWGAGVIPGTTQQADPNAAGVAGSAGQALGTGTGQHGVVPLTEAGGGMFSDGIAAVWTWINKPFTTPLDPMDVFLLVGIVLVAIISWNLILYHIRIAAETI
jgi:hypothetical protein